MPVATAENICQMPLLHYAGGHSLPFPPPVYIPFSQAAYYSSVKFFNREFRSKGRRIGTFSKVELSFLLFTAKRTFAVNYNFFRLHIKVIISLYEQ